MTRYAYILSASHSGSTLLTMMLHSHKQVATVGELAPGGIDHPDRYLCSCGRRIVDCQFWQLLAQRAQALKVPFHLGNFGTSFRLSDGALDRRLLDSMHRGAFLESVRDAMLQMLTPWPERFPEIARANRVVAGLVLDYYSASVFVDKGNRGLRLKYLMQDPMLDVRVIHLVRDGRAVALSAMDSRTYADAARPDRRGGGMGSVPPEKLSMTQAAYNVRRCLQEAKCVLENVHPTRWIRVKYEELCADPPGEMKRILEFLGLDGAWGSDFRSGEHHIVGNGMRLDESSEIRFDERWRSVLTPQQLAAFDRLAGRLNREYGYV